jgi:hypothetical protein
MALLNWDLQEIRSNKEESITLANHAIKITPLLFGSLKTGDDLGLLKPSVLSYVS